MTTANVQKVLDLGGDVLEVTGTVDGVDGDDGTPMLFVVNGWVSAMTHYFPPDAYTPDGDIKADVQPREMTADERLAYWQSLLTNAAPSSTPAPSTVLFESPTPTTGGS